MPEPAKKTTHDPEKTRNGNTLWKPGQSGNPKGRPKGARHEKTLLMEALKKRAKKDGLSFWDLVADRVYTDNKILSDVLKKLLPDLQQTDHTLTPTEDQLELIELQRAKLHAELKALDDTASMSTTAIAWRARQVLLTEGGNGHDNGKE